MTAALAVLFASLLGSPHCAAMCGPFVAFYSGANTDTAPGARLAHAAYSLGRLASYLALGAVAGSLGAGLDRTGSLAGVARLAAIAAGALMVAWGGATMLALRGVGTRMFHAPAFLLRLMSCALAAVRGRDAAVRAAVTGLATALLPCGWLYVFVGTAGGTASPLLGAMTMLIFWTGTLPVMVGLGLGVQRAAGPLRARLPALTATAMVVLGIFTIAGRLRPLGTDVTSHAAMSLHADHR